ncbi:DUF58 domain-containing protein [bacterium]|nr:DUF58 domain-containing protein [bacterium]
MAVTAPHTPLFDDDFLRKLDLLQIVFRRNIVGRREGDRAGQRRGGRTEFADYREYTPGDDPRYLDWNIYGRTGRLFIKEFTHEESARVCVLVDTSASMTFGTPPKLPHALRLAAAFAHLGLVAGNEAEIGSVADGRIQWSKLFAGRPDIQGITAFLESIEPGGGTDLHEALRAFHERVRQRALVVLISDLLDESDLRRALRLLASRRHDLVLLHVLSPQELSPPPAGTVRLVDAETGDAQNMEVDVEALGHYAAALNAFVEDWRTFCQRHDIRTAHTSTATPFEACVLDTLRHGGLVR